ncbi:MAG: hypothetical protein MUW57_21590 [Pseudomonas sp.]|nr:hypothetical protein [Pseudomonas sp.]
MSTVTMSEVKELARQTGNSTMGVLTDLLENGYELVEEAPAPRGNPLASSKDALALWKATKQQVADDLYKSDPLIRQMVDVDNAYRGFGSQPTESVVKRDAFGNVIGTSKSMLTGATMKEQAELMAAIRNKYNQGE